jgi:hypothetical protein
MTTLQQFNQEDKNPNMAYSEKDQTWKPAESVPYYSSFLEKIMCKIGLHGWPIGEKERLKRVREHIEKLKLRPNQPNGGYDEPTIKCYRCNKTLN